MEVGFYGKLPSHGDFLRRRVSDAFVDAWDEWLPRVPGREPRGARAIAGWTSTSRARRGDSCARPARAARAPVLGLMAPSVDRVGRYFPLTLVAELPPYASVIAAATDAASFFDRRGTAASSRRWRPTRSTSTLRRGRGAARRALAPSSVPPPVVARAGGDGVFRDRVAARGRCRSDRRSSWRRCSSSCSRCSCRRCISPLVLWWTEGSAMVEPSCLITRGLPPPDTFAALLDGSWTGHRWRRSRCSVEPDPTLTAARCSTEAAPLRFRSAAATDVGRARDEQRGRIRRAARGRRVGGGRRPGRAQRRGGREPHGLRCARRLRTRRQLRRDDRSRAQRGCSEVNDHLLAHRLSARLPDRSGSTVVDAAAHGASAAAVLWAGDSRVYRWRSGRLQQLSQRSQPVANGQAAAGRRGSIANVDHPGGRPRTRADPRPASRYRASRHDRFLLCSDGLTQSCPMPRSGRGWRRAISRRRSRV